MVSDSPDEGLDDLLEALTGMADYGSVTVRGNGQITVLRHRDEEDRTRATDSNPAGSTLCGLASEF
jgi:hypothetical protein